jgi:hypothetical protein
MPELEREDIFLQRFEEVQRIKDWRNLDRMLKAQKDGDGDSVAKAAKCTFPNVLPRTASEPYLQASTQAVVRLRTGRGSSTS